MGIVTEEYAIGKAFLRQPWKKLAYSEIEKLSKKRSRSFIYRSLEALQKNKIISKEYIGKSALYSLNLNYLHVQSYLGFLEEYLAWSEGYIPQNIIELIAEKISIVTPFFIFIVTGSYSRNDYTRKSDLDVAIICDDSVNPQKIYAEIKYAGDTSIPKVHLYAFRKKEFISMLLDKKQNYGKEIVMNHLIFAGGTIYYSMLMEAVNNGFKG